MSGGGRGVVQPGCKGVLLRFDRRRRRVRRSRARVTRAAWLTPIARAQRGLLLLLLRARVESSSSSGGGGGGRLRVHVATTTTTAATRRGRTRQPQRRELHRRRARRARRSLRRRPTPRSRHERQPFQRTEDGTRTGRELVRELLLQFADRVLLPVSGLRSHADPGHESRRSAVHGRERRLRAVTAVVVHTGVLLLLLGVLLLPGDDLASVIRIVGRRRGRVGERVIRRSRQRVRSISVTVLMTSERAVVGRVTRVVRVRVTRRGIVRRRQEVMRVDVVRMRRTPRSVVAVVVGECSRVRHRELSGMLLLLSLLLLSLLLLLLLLLSRQIRRNLRRSSLNLLRRRVPRARILLRCRRRCRRRIRPVPRRRRRRRVLIVRAVWRIGRAIRSRTGTAARATAPGGVDRLVLFPFGALALHLVQTRRRREGQGIQRPTVCSRDWLRLLLLRLLLLLLLLAGCASCTRLLLLLHRRRRLRQSRNLLRLCLRRLLLLLLLLLTGRDLQRHQLRVAVRRIRGWSAGETRVGTRCRRLRWRHARVRRRRGRHGGVGVRVHRHSRIRVAGIARRRRVIRLLLCGGGREEGKNGQF